MPSTMTTTYRKTKDGKWVAFGPVSVVRAGCSVLVTKKDGTDKYEYITRTGKPFEVNGQQMVYGYIGENARGRQDSRGAGWGVPSRANPSGWCTGRDDCMCFDCGGDM